MRRPLRWLGIATLLLAAACSPTQTSTPFPTLTLIPPTLTYTPSPAPPTATQAPLPAPDEVLATAPSSVLVPLDAELPLKLSLDELARVLEVNRDMIQLIELDSVTWDDEDLGCAAPEPTPARTPTRATATPRPGVSGFRIVLEHDDERYEFHTDGATRVLLCEGGLLDFGVSSMLMEIDPVAAELAALAQRQVAGELDLPARRVQIVDVRLFAWDDTSLGCPLPDQSYEPVESRGYRIVVSAGGEEYLFHTDFDRLIACDPANERLPAEDAAEVTAEATAEMTVEPTPAA